MSLGDVSLGDSGYRGCGIVGSNWFGGGKYIIYVVIYSGGLQ